MTRYTLAPSVPGEVLAAHDPLVRQLLFNRGLTDATAADFLAPNYDEHLHDPFLMTDMGRAVERVIEAVERGERIAIYGDYDCDGIPGGVLLHDFFRAIGYENFENYIPHRHHEGYGFNVDAVEALASRGVSLIVTVDCGIADTPATVRANARGIDVIVTDHHLPAPRASRRAGEPEFELPPAYAILNPKRDEAYPFRELCGSGVAWKLVEALLRRGGFEIKDGAEKWLLDVVGLATIADMVPLVGENRVLAHYGLLVMRKTRRPGLHQLFRSMRLDPRYLTEDDIGFMIAPRINAASRMDTPEDAFHMLALRDESMVGGHVRHLEKLNNERKGVVAAMVKDIKRRISRMTDMRPVLVMGSPEWRPALVGLAANNLVEEYRRPVFLWGRDGRAVIKGSCRSDGSVSVVSLMHEVKDALIEYGGHHVSGGFSVQQEHIHTFDARLNDAYASLRDAAHAPEEEVIIDADLTFADVTGETYRKIARLAPFGEGNPKPLFRFRNVSPVRVEQFGKGKDHLKIVFERDGGGTLEAIGFFATSESYGAPLEGPFDLIAHIEQSFFMNRISLRLRIVDVLDSV